MPPIIHLSEHFHPTMWQEVKFKVKLNDVTALLFFLNADVYFVLLVVFGRCAVSHFCPFISILSVLVWSSVSQGLVSSGVDSEFVLVECQVVHFS